MNFLFSAFFINLVTVSQGREPLSYAKFTRINCVSSNKTCINVYCSIRIISRTDSFINFGCGKIIRPLNTVKISVNLLHRSMEFGNYRKIINIKDLDVCSLLDNVAKFPMFEGYVDNFNSTYPDMVKPCPYTSLNVANASLMRRYKPDEVPKTWEIFPNGYYRYQLLFGDELDDNIGRFNMETEYRVHGRFFQL